MTDTDRELVDQVVEHRVATAQQLAALFDMPERTVRYRMEKLLDLGMVERTTPPVAKGKAADHWYPTKNADSWARGTPVPRGGERKPPGTSFVVHSAAITGLYVALLRLGHAGWTLMAWRRESEAKEHFEAHDRDRKIVPDAFVVLTLGDAEYRAFIEIDMELFLATQPALRARNLTCLRQFFRWARSKHVVLSDPTRRLSRSPTRGFRGKVIDARSQQRLFARWAR